MSTRTRSPCHRALWPVYVINLCVCQQKRRASACSMYAQWNTMKPWKRRYSFHLQHEELKTILSETNTRSHLCETCKTMKRTEAESVGGGTVELWLQAAAENVKIVLSGCRGIRLGQEEWALSLPFAVHCRTWWQRWITTHCKITNKIQMFSPQ